jgi:nucleoside-diphosphate-sugar epimerase
MRVLVTGPNGFLGSHVCEGLAAQGHELRLLLRPTSSLAFLQNVTYQRADGDVRDAEALRKATEGVDAVVHIAGLTAARSEAEYMAVNATGTAAAVRAAAEAGVRRFVYVSSMAAHGPSPDGNPVPGALPRPVSAYGRSKLAGELAVLAQREHLNVAIVRPPVVYGPRDRALLPLFKLAKLRILPLYGDGQHQICWLHVQDTAAAINLVTTANVASGSVYSIMDGEPHTWLELGTMVARALDRRIWLARLPAGLFSFAGAAAGVISKLTRRTLPLTPEKVVSMRERYWVCDNERITAELGWKPRIGPQEGISQTLRWYRDHNWL